MAKDFKKFTIHTTRSQTYNWFIGIDYYEEDVFVPSYIYTRTFQVNLLFFNLTLTHWHIVQSFPGV